MPTTQGKIKGVSLFEIGKDIKQTDARGKVNKNSPSIVDNINPQSVPTTEGYHIVSPNQLASLLVPKQEVKDGKIVGFQREVTKTHARRIAKSIEAGEPLPVLEIGLYRNAAWAVDGQHRALGAIIAGAKLPIVCRKLGIEEMRKLFASQRKARRVNPSVLILSDDNDYAEYIQESVTDDNHPWASLVTYRNSSDTKMTPHQAYECIVRYVGGTLGTHIQAIVQGKPFDRRLADELSTLFLAFGTKKTNPLAFRPIAIRAITYAAVLIVMRKGSKKADIDRWISHMPKFPWEDYMGIRKSKELAYMLIRHWNKRLLEGRRISIEEIV